jgi:geranylgeranyl pyrophosphate synthase
LSPELRVQLISEIARAAGTPDGMVAGQAHDLDAESREVTGQELERIHQHKTGALIRASARCGGMIAGVNESELAALTQYATNLGLLFQITDDVLDVTATAEDLGKTPGKDVRSRKATYPSLYGIEATRAQIETVYSAACAAIEPVKDRAQLLLSVAQFIVRRQA